MPEISRFYGIVIKMLFDDHNPPHIHIFYNDEKALISITELKLMRGDLSPRALGMAIEWTKIHQQELLKDWELAQKKQELFKIDPLK